MYRKQGKLPLLRQYKVEIANLNPIHVRHEVRQRDSWN